MVSATYFKKFCIASDPMVLVLLVVDIYPHITLQVAQRRQNIFRLRRATCNAYMRIDDNKY